MQKKSALTAILFFTLLWSYPAQAGIKKAIIYPKGGTLTFESLHGPGIIDFTLPPQAEPHTLHVQPVNDQFHIRDVQWHKAKVQYSQQIQNIKNSISKLKKRKDELQIEQKAIKANISFWEKQIKTTWSSAQEALRIAEAYRQPLQEAYQHKAEVDKKIAEIKLRIKELQQRLDDLTGSGKQNWEVKVSLHGPKEQQTKILWTYYFAQCGYESSYSVQALPDEEQVSFIQYAKIWQKSGQTWQDVNLVLATVRPQHRIEPPSLIPWIIRPRPKPIIQPKAQSLQADRAREASGQIPERKQKRTYQEWNIGKRTIQAGPGKRIKILSRNWPAQFKYLLRPEGSSQAFLQASIDLKHALQLPQGIAFFFVQGSMVGKRSFSFQGNKKEIYFGKDPLVRCQKKLLVSQSGETGLIKKQTYHWQWEIKIDNSHNRSIEAQLQEPKPQVRDESINIDYSNTQPAPTEVSPEKFVWDLQLEPNQTKKIQVDVRLEAPKDMELILGR